MQNATPQKKRIDVTKSPFNLGAGMFFVLWLLTAHAQAAITPGFGSELQKITWSTWGWVCVFGMIGTMARIQGAIKSKEVTFVFFDVAAWLMVGLFAGLLAFAACEGTAELTGRRIPDLYEGIIIALCAFNPRAAIRWFSIRVRMFIRGDKS